MSLDLQIPSLFSVKGKVALVTGGGTGIGKMITTALVQNGARVYIASRKLEVVESVANELNATHPGQVFALQADLTTKAEAYALAEKMQQREKRLHILVNNAGMVWHAPLLDFPETDGWDRLLALNVKMLFYLTTALVPLLENGANNIDPGRVINISSVAGTAAVSEGFFSPGEFGMYSYNTSKAAANHLTRILAVSLASRFITVNAIAPGFFPSNMTAQSIKESKSVMESSQPMGRIGNTEDMAGIALFLCSRASSHITGAIIPIDGGATLAMSGPTKL